MLLTPEAQNRNSLNNYNSDESILANVNNPKSFKHQTDISCLYYKGMSFLRYAMNVNLDVDTLRTLLSSKYCSNELLTVKDPVKKF